MHSLCWHKCVFFYPFYPSWWGSCVIGRDWVKEGITLIGLACLTQVFRGQLLLVTYFGRSDTDGSLTAGHVVQGRYIDHSLSQLESLTANNPFNWYFHSTDGTLMHKMWRRFLCSLSHTMESECSTNLVLHTSLLLLMGTLYILKSSLWYMHSCGSSFDVSCELVSQILPLTYPVHRGTNVMDPSWTFNALLTVLPT
jgi:hypothetical protein